MGPAPSAAKETGSYHVVFQKGNSMNRSTARNLAVVAGLAASMSGAAFGQLVVDAPVTGNVESFGQNTIVQVDIPAGEDGANNRLLDGEAIQIQAFIVNATGTTVLGGPFAGVVTGAPAYDNAAGNANVQATFAAVNFSGFLVAGNKVVITARTSGATGESPDTAFNFIGLSTVLNVNDEALDTSFDVDTTLPVLQNVFINSAGDRAFFVFNKSVNNNVAANDINHTVIGNITDADFEVDTTNSFDGSEASPTGLSNPAFVGANRSVIRFDRNAAATTLNNGAFARPSFTNATPPVAEHNIFDVVRNTILVPANPGTGVAVAPTPTLSVVSAEWLAQVPANGANVADALRVVFSGPIDVAGSSDDFVFVVSGSDQSNIVLSNFEVDPTNPNAIRMDVDSDNNNFGVAADGRTINSNGDATGIISVRVLNGGGGNAIVDLFGNTFTGPTTVATADRIAPSQTGSPHFVDTNRDGEIDGVVVSYNEPVNAPNGTNGFALAKLGGFSTPFHLITASTPDLPADVARVLSGTIAQNNIAIAAGAFSVPAAGTGVSRISFNPGNPTASTFTARQTNSAYLITFDPRAVDWDNDGTTRLSATPDANEPVPGTDDSNAVNLFINNTTASANNPLTGLAVTNGAIADANGNNWVQITQSSDASNDGAAPAVAVVLFTTGDNQSGGDNLQFFREVDGNAGDQRDNDRLTYIFGENIIGPSDTSFIRFGPGGASGGFGCCDQVFTTGNKAAVQNNNSNPAIVAGVVTRILPGAGINDGTNTTSTNDLTSVGRLAPFVTLQSDVDGNTTPHAAYIFDADSVSTDAGFGFADTIRVTMSQPVDAATVQLSDFTVSSGSITAVAVQGTDIVLTLVDGQIPMTSTFTLTYNAAGDTTRIASTGGVRIDGDANNSVTVQQIPTPDIDTPGIALMDIVGTITTNGTTPVPPGTKIYAMTAVPTAVAITATHNNATFAVDYRRDQGDSANNNGAGDSAEAFTNFLLGIEPFVYLIRDEDNNQDYTNNKFVSLDDDNDFARETIQLTINATNLANVTFTGRGETSTQQVTNGRVTLAWDVLRSDNGTLQDLYEDGFSTYYNNGNVIKSAAVVTGSDGRFRLHHSAPSSVFDGNNLLNGVGKPVILVVELPSGERFAVSSLLSSVNGAPLLFQTAQRSQQTGGQANNATTFNINLANVGVQSFYEGWNLLPFNRQGGWAATAAARPVRPAEVDESEIVVPTSATPIPLGASAVEQFVLFQDFNGDGRWTRDEDSNFTGIVIDSDLYRFFFFTMSSGGVQVNAGINNLIGGYALGVFNDDYWQDSWGVFQFGAPFTGNVLFSSASAATTFPNNATTQGWGLFSSKSGYNPATAARGAATNPRLDYVLYFRNNGDNANNLGLKRIEVQTLDLVPETGETDPQDLLIIPGNQAFFGHFQP